jgi:phosphoribosylformylglycinamidine synthase
MRNAGLKFVSEFVHIRVENNDTLFTNQLAVGDVLRIPVAHGEGRYVADEETLSEIEGEGRVVFRYVNARGERTPGANPNGSINDIAGIVSEAGNVLGMMPHPERAADPLLGSDDGLAIFQSVLERVSA